MFLPPWLWKIIRSRRTRITLVCLPFGLMIAGASFYGYANWKGERDVERHLARLKSLGYATSLEEYYQPAGNPEDDVMQHPAMVEELFRTGKDQLTGLTADHFKSRFPDFAERIKRPERDLAEHEDVRLYFNPPRHKTEKDAAREILDGLSSERMRVDRLMEAINRPKAIWKLNWVKQDSFKFVSAADIPRLGDLEVFMTRLAILHLAAEEPEKAAEIAASTIRMNQHFFGSHPTMTAYLLGTFSSQSCERLIYEGVRRGLWNDSMLADFERQLRVIDPQRTAVDLGLSEFAGHTAHVFNLKQALLEQQADFLKYPPSDWEDLWESICELWWVVRPHGLTVSDAVIGSERLLEYGPNKNGKPRQRFELTDLKMFEQHYIGYPFGIRDLSFFISDTELKASDDVVWSFLMFASSKALATEASIALTRAGIALERYRLKHGGHPKMLASLVPEFLPAEPIDPYDGKPLRYRLQPDGSPWVWSIGIDGEDDGGLFPRYHRSEGDLIWITRPIPGFSDANFRR